MAAPAAETSVVVKADSIVVPDPTGWITTRDFSRATAPQLARTSSGESVDASHTGLGSTTAIGPGRRNPFNNS